MSSNNELNKIFAAVLVAGIAAALSGFISEQLIHPHALKEDAVAIESSEGGAGGGTGGPAMPEPILDLIASADIAKGESLSKACAACHSFGKGEAAKVGPNLWGTVGGPKAHMAGFAYSDDMKAAGGTWSYSDLNHFLWKPKSVIPGTKMNFIGLKKPEDRAAMIAWLRTLGSSAGLPSAAEIAAEKAELAPPAEETAAPETATPEAAPAATTETEKPAETPAQAAH